MYKNIERYFAPCDNCGACCKTPGIFLPDQIDVLCRRFRMDRDEFFYRYLIAELFTPHVESAPAFVLAPVRTDSNGSRAGNFLSDARYARYAGGSCIFRDNSASFCHVHEYKPFGCSLLICGKMTRAKPITLNKTYYYHRWIDSQEILFSVFPQLIGLYRELHVLISALPGNGPARRTSLIRGNALICIEMANVMNGKSNAADAFFYRLPPENIDALHP